MGGLISKENPADKWAQLEHYTKELSEKYEALQEKLDHFSEEFIAKESFNEKISTMLKRFDENQKVISDLFQQHKKLSAENDIFLEKVRALERQMQDQSELLAKFQSICFEKVDSYKETNKSIGFQLSKLAKENRQHNDVLNIGKLSNMAHANGIQKNKQSKGGSGEDILSVSPKKTKNASIIRLDFEPKVIVPVPDN